MRWTVLDTGERARRIADEQGLSMVAAEGAAADGLVLVGGDAELAGVASRVGSELPILFVPAPESDLGRMFRFDQRDLAARLRLGGPYPADLGRVFGSDGERPFVAHAVASKTGRLRPWWARRDEVHTVRDGRASTRRAATVVIANAQHLGGRTVAPRAAIMDGRAEVQYLEGSFFERATALRRMDRGLHLRSGGVHRRPFGDLQVEAPRSWHLLADGRDAGPGPWRVRMETAAYTLWV